MSPLDPNRIAPDAETNFRSGVKLGAAPTLSICIPSYNRKESLLALLNSLAQIPGSFEICVHVDGATDGTAEAVRSLHDVRIKLTESANQGRAAALFAAICHASGQYVMIYDDDDALYPEGLRRILSDCETPLPGGCVGFIYHLDDVNGGTLGSPFPIERTNFLALRADHHVSGDKKEVVLRAHLVAVAQPPARGVRRVPTSLLWSALALKYDVLCRNIAVGQKNYRPGGMTSTLRGTKRRNPGPLAALYRMHIRGYFGRRYRSVPFLVRALGGLSYYGLVSFGRTVFVRSSAPSGPPG